MQRLEEVLKNIKDRKDKHWAVKYWAGNYKKLPDRLLEEGIKEIENGRIFTDIDGVLYSIEFMRKRRGFRRRIYAPQVPEVLSFLTLENEVGVLEGLNVEARSAFNHIKVKKCVGVLSKAEIKVKERAFVNSLFLNTRTVLNKARIVLSGYVGMREHVFSFTQLFRNTGFGKGLRVVGGDVIGYGMEIKNDKGSFTHSQWSDGRYYFTYLTIQNSQLTFAGATFNTNKKFAHMLCHAGVDEGCKDVFFKAKVLLSVFRVDKTQVANHMKLKGKGTLKEAEIFCAHAFENAELPENMVKEEVLKGSVISSLLLTELNNPLFERFYHLAKDKYLTLKQ